MGWTETFIIWAIQTHRHDHWILKARIGREQNFHDTQMGSLPNLASFTWDTESLSCPFADSELPVYATLSLCPLANLLVLSLGLRQLYPNNLKQTVRPWKNCNSQLVGRGRRLPLPPERTMLLRLFRMKKEKVGQIISIASRKCHLIFSSASSVNLNLSISTTS